MGCIKFFGALVSQEVSGRISSGHGVALKGTGGLDNRGGYESH